MRVASAATTALSLLLSIQVHGAPAGAASPDLAPLDSYIEKARVEWEVPGLSVAIVKDGKVVFAKGYGVKEKGGREAVDADTLFAIASNTKAFTSAALAILNDEKKLKWDDRVSEIPALFRALRSVGVARDASRRSALPPQRPKNIFRRSVVVRNVLLARGDSSAVRAICKPAFPFRAGYGYSNLMFLAAGEVVAKASGESWDNFVRERIFVPLAMKRTITSTRQLDAAGNFAIPHTSFTGAVERNRLGELGHDGARGRHHLQR